MKKINYNPESQLLSEMVLNYQDDILKIYEAIYSQSKPLKVQKSHKKEKCQSVQGEDEKKINPDKHLSQEEGKKR